MRTLYILSTLSVALNPLELVTTQNPCFWPLVAQNPGFGLPKMQVLEQKLERDRLLSGRSEQHPPSKQSTAHNYLPSRELDCLLMYPRLSNCPKIMGSEYWATG